MEKLKRRVTDIIQKLEYDQFLTKCISKGKTEKELMNEEILWPKSEEELLSYIRSLVDKNHDYGTCVYAMSMSALATFYYVSHKLKVSGFQAGCADLNIIKRLRNFKCGFMIIDYKDVLYPQKKIFVTSKTILKKNIEVLAKEAKNLLKNANNASTEVFNRWKYIVNLSNDKSFLENKGENGR